VGIGEERWHDKRDGMNKSFSNSIVLIVLSFVLLMSPLIYEQAKGELTPKQLAAVLLIFMGCLFAFLLFRFTQARLAQGQPVPSKETAPSETGNARRTARVAVLILPVLLVIGLWVTRDGPLLPRVVGAAINIFFTCWFLFLLVGTKSSAK